jgi:hypothetical protein
MHSDAIPATMRTKLAKLLGMLGSDHAGERDAAALAAHRLVVQTGLTWQQVVMLPAVKREPLFSTWRATCAELAKRPGDLRPWERKFLADLPGFRGISTRQRYVLKEIADRVLGRDAP